MRYKSNIGYKTKSGKTELFSLENPLKVLVCSQNNIDFQINIWEEGWE